MTEEWIPVTVHELRQWAERRDDDDDIDVAGVRLLLELAQSGLELTGAGAFRPGHFRRLLLEEFPQAVLADPEDAPEVIAAARVLADFLAATGAVPAEDADRLRDEIDAIGPEFTEALAEPDIEPDISDNMVADVLAKMMVDDEVDLTDEGAVERWLYAFESLPEQEKLARAADYLALPALPAIRLAPEHELAAAARGSGLLARAAELTEWAAGRELTGDVGLADPTAAAAAVGMPTPRATGKNGEPRVPELDRLWRVALSTGLAVADDERAAKGSGLRTLQHGDDVAVLELWLAAFTTALGLSTEYGDRLSPFDVVEREFPGVLLHLYEDHDPVRGEELYDLFWEHVQGRYEMADTELWTTVARYAFDLQVDDLVEWGVLAVVDDGADDQYELTRLGIWSMWRNLAADGYPAPVVGDLAERDAHAFIEGLAAHTVDTIDDEIALWLEHRRPERAAAELMEIIRTGGASPRNLAAAVLQRVGPDAERAVRSALEDPVARPYAAIWLIEHGDGSVQLARRDLEWVFTDTLAGTLADLGPEEAVRTAVTDAPRDVDMTDMVADLWRLDHPDVAAVLEALGDHHPDQAVASAARKAARKAAVKARSRG